MSIFVRRGARKSWRRKKGSIGAPAGKVRQLKDMSEDEIKAIESKYGCKVSTPGVRVKCKSCSAPIVWTRTESGKRLPCDVEPTDDGLFYLFRRDDRIEAIYVNSSHPSAVRARARGQKRYRSHYITCVG
jgi:hypothetical protein